MQFFAPLEFAPKFCVFTIAGHVKHNFNEFNLRSTVKRFKLFGHC